MQTEDDKKLYPLLLEIVNKTTWADCHPMLKLNFAKMKELAQLFRRTRENLIRHGTSQNKEVWDFMKQNPQVVNIVLTEATLGHITHNSFDGDDALMAMDIFINQYEAGMTQFHPSLIGGIYRAFKAYRDPKKKDYLTLDHIFRLKEGKQKPKDNFVIPESVREFAHQLIETDKKRTDIVKELQTKDKSARQKGYDHYWNNFKEYKWLILHEYLWDKAIVNKKPLALIPKQRARITKWWDGIELPEKLMIDENLIPAGDIKAIREMIAKL